MFGVARRTRGAHNLLGANMRKRAFDTCTEEVGSTILRAKTLTEVSLNNVRRNKRCSYPVGKKYTKKNIQNVYERGGFYYFKSQDSYRGQFQ